MNIEVLAKNENQERANRINNLIIDLRDLINHKKLEPGDKLPSERVLSEKFNVSRRTVRAAILKLESYGILKSMPQSGTFIANIGPIAMNGMIKDILDLGIPDFKALIEVRILLELKAVSLAAERRTEKDLINIKEAILAHNSKIDAGDVAVQEDLLFHLAIAKASGNVALNMFMITITPQIIMDFKKYHLDYNYLDDLRVKEHTEIFEAIKNQDAKMARAKMKEHFKKLYEYCSAS
ncbi:FadR/GntR family transcriptional regulator [Winogradskyella sp. PE311]|uniref:FadR/GntR family transcriptional regulator n=1 Tax=Winogradskyella sp. PE311 TaxID=3366943 RepID=UPI00397ED965